MEGARPVVITRYIKETTIAIEEIVSSEFTLLTGKEARKAIMETARELAQERRYLKKRMRILLR